MGTRRLVLDANIAIKVLHRESDSEVARRFLQACATRNRRILVPEHFLYERVNVSQRLGIAIQNVLKLFEAMKGSILTVVTPTPSAWLRAEKIANDGHEKSGFPSIYDSIYHGLAIESEAVFITADKRHYAKARHHSGVCLLEDWESVFVKENSD